jgi:hypothetical protein
MPHVRPDMVELRVQGQRCVEGNDRVRIIPYLCQAYSEGIAQARLFGVIPNSALQYINGSAKIAPLHHGMANSDCIVYHCLFLFHVPCHPLTVFEGRQQYKNQQQKRTDNT